MGKAIKIRKSYPRKLRIAFLSFYSGSVNRGVESFVDQLSSFLGKMHEVVVYQQGEPKDRVKYKIIQVSADVNWNKKDMTGTLARRFYLDYWSMLIGKFTFRVAKEILREKYDVVVPLNGGYQPILVRLATWLSGTKMVGIGQSGVGWDERINLWCFPNAFVPLSSAAFSWCRRVNRFIRLKRIPNGVDLNVFRSGGESVRTRLKRPVVVCVGALVSQKRIEFVIRAVAELQDVSLLVVGDGEQKDELERLGKRLLGERYEQISVGHDEMPEIYRAGDVFCLTPERSEAFGIVFVEAMATNLPVVTIKDEQRQEIVGDAGVLVRDPRNSGKLAKAINKALKRKWGSEPRRQAEKFGWERIAREYEKLFLEICK